MKPLPAHLAPPDLTPAQRLVYGEYVSHADQMGLSWPSVATVVERTHLARNTVRGAIRRLIELGLILPDGSVKARHGSPVQRFLVVGKGSVSDPFVETKGSTTDPFIPDRGQSATPSRGQSVTPIRPLGSVTDPEVDFRTTTSSVPEDNLPKKIVCNCCGDKYRPGEEHANQQNIGWVCQPVASDRWKTRERYQRRTARR